MLLHAALKYNTERTMQIASFNEWYYAHQIEPAEEYGFDYLNILKESLLRKP
jgi:hypothetical protein